MKAQKQVILFLILLIAGFGLQAQNKSTNHKGLLSDKPKKLIVELKAGQGFLGNMSGTTSNESKVFCGGGNLSYGFMLRNNFIGFGGGVTYYDMYEGSFDFPVFLQIMHFMSNESDKGFFIGAKGGYIFGGNTSIAALIPMPGEEMNGTIERSMKGPYGEVLVGYRFYGTNFFASYNYRVINYETIVFPNNSYIMAPLSSSSRVMHTVMLGFSFMLF